MALEDSYGHLCKELFALQNGAATTGLGAGGGGYGVGVGVGGGGFGFLQEEKGFLEMLDNWGDCSSNYNSLMQQQQQQQQQQQTWDGLKNSMSPPEEAGCTRSEIMMVEGDHHHHQEPMGAAVMPTPGGGSSSGMIRRKRRRTRTTKNKEELENQRMTHIAVERNRRRQMNDYLTIIRSLMPSSYVQRGDQASIIGGAINFVKELEQHLQTLEAEKRNTIINSLNDNGVNISSIPPLFGDFFTYPQYTSAMSSSSSLSHQLSDQSSDSSSTSAAAAATVSSVVEIIPNQKRPAAAADIEVSMADSHANLKILSKKRPRQLLKLVAGLQCLWFTILHLYVTTVDQMVLYSISVKIEEGCQLTTIDEIADAVNHLLGRIDQEAALS